MVQSVARQVIDLPAERAFDRLTATKNHERLIPLTTIATPDRRPQVGDLTVAVSAGILVDRMVLTVLTPPTATAPGRARWVKLGPVLHGEAEVRVSALGPRRCVVEWVEEDIRLAALPDALTVRPFTAAVALMTRFALLRLARLVDAERRRSALAEPGAP